MKDFNLVELLRKECYEEHIAKKDQVETNLLLDTATRRQRDGNETTTRANVVPRSSLRHYLDLTSKRPRPDSVSNPCRVRVLDYPQGISGLFSSLFSGLSFARVWKYAAMVTLLLTLACGNVWAQTSWVRLDSINFTNTTNFPAVTYTGQSATVHGVFFRAKSSKNVKVNNTTPGVDFDGTNVNSSGDHCIAIPVTGVNGSLKVIVYHDYNNTSANHKVGISHAEGNAPSASQTWDQTPSNSGTKNNNDFVFTKSSLTGTDYIVWVGESSSSYKVIKRVAIYTEAPSCTAADLTASNITSNGDQEAGTGITFSKVGSPASGDTWYWQTSATGTDKTYNATSPYTTATTAGSYTVYLRAFNTDCWGTAASMTNTIYPAPSAMIHNTFAVNDAWSSTIATQDKTNITSLNAMAAVGESVGSGSNKSGLTQKIPSQSSEDASKYMSLSFNVASGKQLNVTSVVFDEQPVTGTGTFKVSISDNQGSTTKTQTIASDAAGSKHTLTLDGDIVGSFKGTVTVKVWAYGWGEGYRFGDYFYINGTVTASCLAPTTTFANGSYTIGGSALDLSTLIGSNNSSGAITYTVKNANGTGASISTASFTATTAGTCTVTATQAANGDKCEKVMDATITVNAAVASGWKLKGSFDGWSDGYDMTGSGTVSVSRTLDANTRYEFKIVDGSTWYQNGGSVIGGTKTTTAWTATDGSNSQLLTTDAGTYTFSFNTDTKVLTVTYPNSYTFYYGNTGNWSNVYVYKFTSIDSYTGNDASWPGTVIASPAYTCGGTDYYAATSDGYAKLIFTNNSSQTGDMVVSSSDAGKCVSGTGSSWTAFPTYTVTYNGNGNTGGSVPTDASSPYACSSTVTVLGNTGSLVRSGYTFNGWNTDSGGGGTSYTAGNTFTISANTTLYAQWEAIKYTVTYNVNGGGSVTPTSATQASGGASLTLPTPTWSGYTFDGWYNAGTKIGNGGTSYIPTADITLYAHWTDNISGKLFSYVDGHYGDKCKAFDFSGWVSSDQGGSKDKTYTNGTTGIELNIDDGGWDNKSATTSIVAPMIKFIGTSTTKMSVTIPSGKHATITILYGSYSKNDKYLKLGDDALTKPSSNMSDPVASTSGFATVTLTDKTGTVNGFTTNSGNVYIAKVSAVITGYTISYAAGTYGSGSLASGTKTHGSNFTLSSSDDAFERDGYYYDGWSTNADGSTKDYELGETYSTDAAITLYPHWVKLCVAPSLAASDATPTGVTLTVTDADDVNNYDFYVSTSSATPAADAPVTYTTTSKTLVISDRVANTTYYAWVRSVCSESNKSGWAALTGNTFTTSTVTVTHTLSNVTKTSGATTAGGSDYTAVYSADTDYSMPTPSVTIGGNSATSGTDYTWTAGTGTITIPANKITGNIVITLSSAAVAPTNVAISGTYHYYPGETISLTATATGGNGPKTYQWYHGGTADGNAIEGATSATFSKTCVAGDAGAYYCKVTCGGSASTWSDGAGHNPFNVKIMQFVLKNNSSVEISRTALTKVDATHATVILHLTGGTTYKFRITDGCGNYFGNTGTMTNGNSTNWYMDSDADCGMTTGLKTSNYTFNVTLGDLGNGMQVTAVYPGGDQAASKIIYWDNSVLNWAAGSQWYRIGKSTHHNKIQMELVYGTANLYKVTTIAYNGFEYWHIANNQGEGTGNLFWTKDNDPTTNEEITNAMDFEGAPVTLDAITVTPTTSHATGETSDNDNCQFYTHTTIAGMKTDNVAITAPSHGTLTVNYVDVNNTAQAFSSGNRDLAHTCIITVTAVPENGYVEPATISINGSSYGNRDPYILTGNIVVSADFSPATYTVTLNTNEGTINAGNVTEYTFGVGATLPTNVTKTGYTFDGWYDNAGFTGSAVSSITTSDFGNKTYWAKWTINNYNLTWNLGGGTTTSAGTGIASGVSVNTTTSQAYGTALTSPTVTKTGYNFGGWSPGVAGTMPAEATTYTATWTAKTCTVSFDIEGGTGTITSVTATYGASMPSKASNLPTKTGHTFDGFWDGDDGTGTQYYNADGTSARNWDKDTESATTLYAKWTVNNYDVSVTLTGSHATQESGSTGTGAATYGTNYVATFEAVGGYKLPSDVTVSIGGSTKTKGTEYTWSVSEGVGTLTITGSYILGNIAITVTAEDDCPASGSGRTVYKFEVKSDVSSGNICTTQNVPVSLSTPTQLTTLTGGTLQGLVTSSSMNNLTFASGRITYANGSAGVLILTLDCAVKTGDIIRFVNYSSSNSKYNYLRHTSNSTTTNQITLNASTTAGTVQEIVVPSAFNNKDVLYIVSGSNTTGISYFEIIRPYVVTLDANTNGGNVGGENTATYYAASGEEIVLPHAFKSDNYFNGWFPNASTGDAVSNPYTPTGSTTLYAQFGDCPDEGTVYKFQVATGLDNGGTGITSLTDLNIGNYLSNLVGGTLEGYASNASYLSIAGNNAFSFENNGTYLKVTLDCALQAGDKFKSTTANKKFVINKTANTSGAFDLTLGTDQETDVPAGLVGEKTLYIYRSGSNTPSPTISYFEVYRPEGFAVTYHKNDGSATTQVNTVSTVEDNMFTRNGYTFVKWHTEADGTSGVDKAVGAAVTAAIDLYAIWECTTPTFGTDLSTTPHVVREGDDAVTLTVAASANSGTVTYQWYSNTSKSTAGATTLTTGATYNAPTSSLGTLYYYCVATNTTGGGCTAQSAYATVTVNEVPCFEFAGGTKDSGWPVAIDGSITTSLYKTSTGAVLTGGTVVNSGTATIGSNDGVKGLVFDAAGNNAITITLSGTHAFAVGTVITISGASGDDNSSSNNFGFSVNGNNLETTSLSTAKASFEKSYTVAASDGVEGGKTIQIKLNTSCLRKTYLKSVTVTGCAEVTGYTIAFEGNGNTGGSMSDVTEIEEGNDVTLAANGFTKNGYSFANWTADVAVTVNSATVAAGDPIADEATIQNVTSDITLTAQWTPNNYTITYNLNGASWADAYSAPANYTVGTGATLPVAGNMTNTGYTFNGWKNNSGLTGDNITAIGTSEYGNKEYWAKWTENTYTVTYSANGGTGDAMSNTVGHYVTLSANTYTKSGYIFAGWNTATDGSGASYSEGEEIELKANLDLYAIWATDYTITWDASPKLSGVAAKPNLGGGNYTITASVATWTGSLTTSMISAETSGVTITGVSVDNSASPKTITATFNVGATVVGDKISFTLDVPAAGVYGAKSSTEDFDIDRCTGSSSGSDGVLFSAEFKDSGLGTSNICDAANTPYTFTTAELKAAPTGGSIKAFSTSNLSHMKYATNAISIAGSDGVIQIDLDNPIATNDLFTYLNVNSSTSSAYLRHTSPTTTTDQIALTVYNSKEAKVRLTSGFNGERTLYIVRNSSDFKLHKAAVVRPAFLMLLRDDTPTSDTNLEGTDKELTTENYLTTINGGHAYYTSPSSGNLKIKRSSSKNYINFNNAAGYVKIVLNDALQEGDVIGFDSYNTNNLALTTTATRSTSIVTTNQLYTVDASSDLKGKYTFYLWQNSGSSDFLRGLQIARSGVAGGGGGTDQITPTLTWTPALNTDGDWDSGNSRLNKETGDADFTFTVTQDKNSLGALTYSSSNTGVATVTAGGTVHIVGAAGNATITATIAESGCYAEATASYNITVVDNCEDVAGTISTENLGCPGIRMTVTGHTTTASTSYQWYKDGATIGGATSDNYTATTAGEYYVIVTNTGEGHCPMASTNTVTIEATGAVSATKIVDSWYVKNGRRTPDIALIQTTDASAFTVKNGLEEVIWNSDESVSTGFAGCPFHMGDDGIIYLDGQTSAGAVPTGLTAGDETLTITVSGCSGSPVELSITIHKQAATKRPSVAFVVDGTKEGDFDEEEENHSVTTALYQFLDYGADEQGAFDLTGQNVYSTVDEKAIREHYSQFDAILITDDPSTDTKIGKKSCVDAFGTMIDVRPILTMEAFVAKWSNWKAKGIDGNPTSPNPRQYAMKLDCKDHAIFKGIDPSRPNVETEIIDGVEYWTVTVVDNTKSPYSGLADNSKTDETPALQGFSASDVSGLLLLGEISDGALYAGVERQEEPAARLMLLGLNNKALPSALTEEGKQIIENALKYLIETDMEKVDDCSNYFVGTTSDDWNLAANWSKNHVPNSPNVRARILSPCVVYSGTFKVAEIDIATSGKSLNKVGDINGKLTVNAGAALIVGGKIRTAEAPYFNTGDLMPTTVTDLVINNTSGSNQAALVFNNDKGDTKATVNLYSLGRKIGETNQFQYFAIPMTYLPVNPSFAGAGIYTYVWEEASGWERRGYYTDLYAFEGVGITTNESEARTYNMAGTLASTATKEISLTADNKKLNLVGNSWTAPIQISQLSDEDFSDAANVEEVIYIYCAGSGKSTIDGTTETAGQWLAIPFEATDFAAWEGLKVIPAMQSFQIKVSDASTMTLDYSKHVRGATTNLTEKLRSPQRKMENEDVELMRIRVADSKTHTDLYLFEGNRFSDAFDNGWEANYRVGDNQSAKLYARTSIGVMAVAAMSDLEGTQVYFIPGQETEYTFTFGGNGMGYYLNDLKLQKSTLINEWAEYRFTYETGDAAARFMISATPYASPQITTDVGNTDSEELKVKKVIYNDKLYIIRGGRVYSAEGALVK